MTYVCTIFKFPKELAKIICEYGATWQFLPWVEELTRNPVFIKRMRHDMMRIWENPNGIDMALRENLPMSWSNLSANSHPWALARLRANPDKISWEAAFANPGFFLKKYFPEFYACGSHAHIKNKINRQSRHRAVSNPREEYVNEFFSNVIGVHVSDDEAKFIGRNPHPRMVEFVINAFNATYAPITQFGWAFHSFPSAWANPNKVMFDHLMEHSNHISWKFLSANPLEDALRLLRNNPNKIDWSEFLTNPGIFMLRVDAGVFELMANNKHRLDQAVASD